MTLTTAIGFAEDLRGSNQEQLRKSITGAAAIVALGINVTATLDEVLKIEIRWRIVGCRRSH